MTKPKSTQNADKFPIVPDSGTKIQRQNYKSLLHIAAQRYQLTGIPGNLDSVFDDTYKLPENTPVSPPVFVFTQHPQLLDPARHDFTRSKVHTHRGQDGPATVLLNNDFTVVFGRVASSKDHYGYRVMVLRNDVPRIYTLSDTIDQKSYRYSHNLILSDLAELIILAFHSRRNRGKLRKYQDRNERIGFFLKNGYVWRSGRNYWPITCFKCGEAKYTYRSPVGKREMSCDSCLSKRKTDQDASTDALKEVLTEVLTSDPYPYMGDDECSITREIGRIKWFGGYDYRRNKENDYGFIERIGESDLYINRKHVTCSSTKLVEGVLVTFEVATDPKTGKAQARNLNLLEQEDNPTIIARCFDSEDPGFWRPVVKKHFEILDEDEMIEAAIKKLKTLQLDRMKAIIADNIPIHVLLTPQYRILREHLSSEKCAYVYNRVLDSYHDQGLSLDEILDEIEEKAKTQGALAYSFWLNIQDRIDYGSRLFNIAPDSVRKKIIECRYREVVDVVEKCVLPKAEMGYVAWEPHEVYADITEEDDALARMWMKAEGKTLEGSKAKMLSARCAEKVAQRFYSSLGFEVEDIARTQLSGSSRDWTTHDLLLNKEIPVDVKNARTPFNSWDRYVNHCVPRFKNTRDNIEVVIVGVLSPYISADGPKGGLFESAIRVLGEIRRSRIRELENEFLQENAQFVESVSLLHVRTIPPWLFDYPKEFYSARDKHLHQLRTLDASDIPDLDVFRTLGVNPVPALLAAGVQLPPRWNILSDWQQEFYDELLGRPLDLPNVFLSILGHFLKVVSSAESAESYSPNHYKTLLYAQPGWCFNESPLGIYDPLDIVCSLCETLEILWESKETTELRNFYTFKFNGLGLLQGKKRGDGDRWTTIIAYCGGITEKKVKCGFSPLILGRHESCPHCRRLVCPECGYCSLHCHRNAE